MERRRRAEQVLVSVVATSYLLGVSTRRVEKLVGQLGIAGLSKSQVSEMAKSLDEQVEASRSRPLDDGPYAFVWLDALTQKVREHGRTQVVHALIAVGVLDVEDSGSDGVGPLLVNILVSDTTTPTSSASTNNPAPATAVGSSFGAHRAGHHAAEAANWETRV